MKKTKKEPEHYFPIHDPVVYSNKYQAESKLSFKEAITHSMTKIGEAGGIFIGYSLVPGDAMGTLVNVPMNQKIETPVAENLMVGIGIGMSLEGFITVVYFERHDFMLVAADAIVNHLAKMKRISHGEFNPKVILKTVVDDGGLFYSGPTHSQNFTSEFKSMVDFPILVPNNSSEALKMYEFALKCEGPVMIVEKKSLF
jgi:pyruvate/2-oxoglutarate/acetoin dehydrogenase E1 component